MDLDTLFSADRKRGRRRRRRSGRAAAGFGDKRPLVGKRVLGTLGGPVAKRSTRSSFVYAKGNTLYEARVSKRARKPAKKTGKGKKK